MIAAVSKDKIVAAQFIGGLPYPGIHLADDDPTTVAPLSQAGVADSVKQP
jgi:hypothetical protein